MYKYLSHSNTLAFAFFVSKYAQEISKQVILTYDCIKNQ
jgi:hypothetical protein